MAWFSSAKEVRLFPCLAIVLLFLFTALWMPRQGSAHFSYSDPRIIHIAEQDASDVYVLVRMPAPLVLLPDNWQGQEEPRVPPFAVKAGSDVFLDLNAIETRQPELTALLNRSLSLWADGRRLKARIEKFRFWDDDARPSFGTLKSAEAALNTVAPANAALLPYYDLTLDVMLTLPAGSLSQNLRLTSDLGRNFQVIEKFGTVVKLHRSEATETKAMIGVLDVSFPKARTEWDVLASAAMLGAEHIYFGLDHLAIIALIAIAALSWQHATALASAFTAGHMITLAAGLYGITPSPGWFIPLVELGIALTIIAAGLSIFQQTRAPFGGIGMFVIGLIHGYGFAASASEAVFAGSIDPLELIAFAAGLELCQLAIYAVILPVILLADHTAPQFHRSWRRGLALCIALLAISPALTRLNVTTTALGLV